MKFYGITMQGKFINQTLTVVPPTFNPSTDVGRLIYNEDDGFLWWGDGEDGRWRSIGEGGGDASEMEDMYSDLLRTSIFSNASWNEFWENMTTDPYLNVNAPTSPELADTWNGDLKAYIFTSAGQVLESNTQQSEYNMYDPHTELPDILYCMPSCFWLDAHPHTTQPDIWVTNNGVDWEPALNNDVHKFTTTGTNLGIRLVSNGPGTLFSWGVLYNKDISVGCSKQALTTKIFVHPEPLVFQYTPGSIMVYLNGLLLADDDYTATDGETITIDDPALQVNDIIQIISFGTSIMDADNFIRKDAALPWNSGVEQSVNNGHFTLLGDGDTGVNGDSVNMQQMDEDYTGIQVSPNRHSKLYNAGKTTTEVQVTASGVDVTDNKILNVTDGTVSNVSKEAVNGSQLYNHQSIVRITPIIALQGIFGGSHISYSNFDKNSAIEYPRLNWEYEVWDASLLTTIPDWATGLMFRLALQVDQQEPALAGTTAVYSEDQQHLHFYMHNGAGGYEVITYANNGRSVKNTEQINYNDFFAIPHESGNDQYQIKISYNVIGGGAEDLIPPNNEVEVKLWLTGYYR